MSYYYGRDDIEYLWISSDILLLEVIEKCETKKYDTL